LSFPVVTWFYQREAIWISLPFAFVMAGGGLMTVVAIWRRLPSRVFFSTALTVLIGVLCASIWILPFIDPYKSARSFAFLVKKTVPLTQPLYIYADTMNDFNFYAEREVIPILFSQAEVESMMSQEKTAHMLIRERDLKKVNVEKRAEIVATGQVGDKKWYLIRVGKEG